MPTTAQAGKSAGVIWNVLWLSNDCWCVYCAGMLSPLLAVMDCLVCAKAFVAVETECRQVPLLWELFGRAKDVLQVSAHDGKWLIVGGPVCADH